MDIDRLRTSSNSATEQKHHMAKAGFNILQRAARHESNMYLSIVTIETGTSTQRRGRSH